MKEFDLRIPVANWMLQRGLIPILEMYSLNSCDLVGFEFHGRSIKRMVAVELKLKNVAEVIRQCQRHLSKATEVWAALPPFNWHNLDVERLHGVGLLEVRDAKVTELIRPVINEERNLKRWMNTAWRRRKEYLWRMTHPQMLKYPAMKLACGNLTNEKGENK